jgi:hypothetical protein
MLVAAAKINPGGGKCIPVFRLWLPLVNTLTGCAVCGPRRAQEVVTYSESHNREFKENREVVGVEGIDSLNAIGLHGGDDLQAEHVAAGHGMAAKQVQQPVNRIRRDR